jgi:glycosyltransferase involved in cell wall biosynthesis
MKLSILIPTLHRRKQYFDRIEKILNSQLTDKVEILTEIDNGELSIGAKRNKLMNRAKGDYTCFVDDDDLVSSDYIQKILEAIKYDCDCVGIHLLHFNDGVLGGFTYHSLQYSKWFENKDSVLGVMRYYRNPNHINPIKRELALKCPFPDISMAEDKDFSTKILPYLHTEAYIHVPIYYYMFRSHHLRDV